MLTLIRLFNKYLLNDYHVLGSLVGTAVGAVNKIDRFPAFMKLLFWSGGSKQQKNKTV